jgi:four helix bundle protein
MDFENIIEEPGKPYNIRHRCFFFATDVIFLVKDAKFDYVYNSLFNQLIKSASSIGANLVEGKAGSSKRDWKNFNIIALKSANETKYWLCLIRDTMDIDKERIEGLLKEADEISKIIASVIVKAGQVGKE